MLLDRLKHETAAIHTRLERDLHLTEPPVTRQNYLGLLQRFYGFYQPAERRLHDSLSAALVYLIEQRTKLGRLVDDMLYLGVPAEQLHAVPRAEKLPSIRSTAEALGTMYVFEGATLGGQVIVRQVRTTLGLHDGRGCSFFASYGDEVGRMWQSFRAVLLAHSSPGSDDEMVEAAKHTFQCLHAWLTNEGRAAHALA